MSVTDIERFAYAQRMQAALGELQALHKVNLEAMLKTLQDAQAELNRQMGKHLTTYGQFNVKEMSAIVEAQIRDVKAELRRVTKGSFRSAVELSGRMHAPALEALGITEYAAEIRGLDATQLATMSRMSFDMIDDLGRATATQVKNAVLLGAMGTKNPVEVMQMVGASLEDKSIFRTMSLRAEHIVRTETNRVYDVATQGRLMQSADIAGTDRIQKQWWYGHFAKYARHSHMAMHGEVADVNARFSNGLMFPHEPGAPASEVVSCKCHQVAYVPGYSPTQEELQAQGEPGEGAGPTRFGNKTPYQRAAAGDREEWLKAHSSGAVDDIRLSPGEQDKMERWFTTARDKSDMRTKHDLCAGLTDDLKDNDDFNSLVREYLETHGIDDVDDWIEYPEWLPKHWTQADKERYSTIDQMIRNWAGTSGDNDLTAVQLQLATQREFGIVDAVTSHFGATWTEALDTMTPGGLDDRALRAFIRAMYNRTQRELERQGFEYVTVMRGMRMRNPSAELNAIRGLGEATIDLQPASSFSSDIYFARSFATTADYNSGICMVTRVHRSQVLSTAHTGFGCMSEHEVVLLGGRRSGLAWHKQDGAVPSNIREFWGVAKRWVHG